MPPTVDDAGPSEQQAQHTYQAGPEVRRIDQSMRDHEANVFQTGIDFRVAPEKSSTTPTRKPVMPESVPPA